MDNLLGLIGRLIPYASSQATSIRVFFSLLDGKTVDVTLLRPKYTRKLLVYSMWQ